MIHYNAGKGDKFRDVDKKKYDETVDKLFGDYCRLSHKHDKDCKIKDNNEKN